MSAKHVDPKSMPHLQQGGGALARAEEEGETTKRGRSVIRLKRAGLIDDSDKLVDGENKTAWQAGREPDPISKRVRTFVPGAKTYVWHEKDVTLPVTPPELLELRKVMQDATPGLVDVIRVCEGHLEANMGEKLSRASETDARRVWRSLSPKGREVVTEYADGLEAEYGVLMGSTRTAVCCGLLRRSLMSKDVTGGARKLEIVEGVREEYVDKTQAELVTMDADPGISDRHLKRAREAFAKKSREFDRDIEKIEARVVLLENATGTLATVWPFLTDKALELETTT